MRKSRSNRMVRIFAVIAVPFLLWQTLDWSPRPAFVVTEGSGGTVTLHRDLPIRPGQRIMAHGSIHTQLAPATLVYKQDDTATTIILDKRTHVDVRAIEDDHISLYASRGHWTIEPDRAIQSCTRAVCIETAEPVDVYYYTPGEVVEVRAGGDALVRFDDATYQLHNGDRIVIDELTHDVRMN